MKLSYLLARLDELERFSFSFLALTESSFVLFLRAGLSRREKCLVSLYVICFISAVGFRKSWVDCSVSQVLLTWLMTTDEEEEEEEE